MPEPIRHELHDARSAATAVVRTETAGIAVAHQLMHRTPEGPWIPCGHGGDEKDAQSGRYECTIPALPKGSIVRALFIAAGRQEGDKFRVEFHLEQAGQVLASPDKPFAETLRLGEGARLEWAWRFVLD